MGHLWHVGNGDGEKRGELPRPRPSGQLSLDLLALRASLVLIYSFLGKTCSKRHFLGKSLVKGRFWVKNQKFPGTGRRERGAKSDREFPFPTLIYSVIFGIFQHYNVRQGLAPRKMLCYGGFLHDYTNNKSQYKNGIFLKQSK